MANYRLSAAAEDDLDRLYIYGVLSFGLEQTESYTAGLIDHFAILGTDSDSAKTGLQKLAEVLSGFVQGFCAVDRRKRLEPDFRRV